MRRRKAKHKRKGETKNQNRKPKANEKYNIAFCLKNFEKHQKAPDSAKLGKEKKCGSAAYNTALQTRFKSKRQAKSACTKSVTVRKCGQLRILTTNLEKYKRILCLL